MTDADLSTRFDQLREYVDLAVTVPGPVTPAASGQDDRIPRTRRWGGRRRVVLPVLAAVIVIVVAIAVTIATHARIARHTAAPLVPAHSVTGPVLSCPKTPPTASSPTDLYPLPRPGPHPLTVADRLVPMITPVHAVVCAYVHPHSQTLTGSRIIDNDLANIPATLGSVPPQTNQHPCLADLRISDGDTYLIGLTYPTGTMWISAPDSHCLGSSNGYFTADTHVATAVIQAYRTGTWASPAPKSSNECLPATGRLGQQSALVPGTPVSLVVCRNSDAKRAASATDTELAAIVAALNRLPTARDSYAFKCAGQGYPAVAYTLIFKYSAGPPVMVNIYQGCSPAIHNGNLQAADAATVLPVLQQILNH